MSIPNVYMQQHHYLLFVLQLSAENVNITLGFVQYCKSKMVANRPFLESCVLIREMRSKVIFGYVIESDNIYDTQPNA